LILIYNGIFLFFLTSVTIGFVDLDLLLAVLSEALILLISFLGLLFDFFFYFVIITDDVSIIKG